jgi:hypothetical protein
MKNFEKIVIGILIFLCLITMMNTCSSCSNKGKIDSIKTESFVKTDSVASKFLTREQMQILLEIQGLEDEKRTILNINQIYLTKKRPDERVLEIDAELGPLREKYSKAGGK